MNRKEDRIELFGVSSIVLAALVLGLLSWMPGCSHGDLARRNAERIIGDIESVDAELKKSVWLLFPADRSFLAPRKLNIDFYRHMLDGCQALCPEIAFQRSEPGEDRALPETPPKSVFDRVDNFELALAGRRKGAGAIVICDISDVRRFQEELGFWWFSEYVNIMVVDVMLTVYDTETGAKLLERVISRETEIDEPLAMQIDRQEDTMPAGEVIPLLESMAEDAGEAICDLMADQPFKTYVDSLEGEKVVLSTGENGGMVEGVALAVYGKGQLINGKYGHRFFTTGALTGVVRITTVFPDKSEGEIISGTVDGKGACAKPLED